MTITVRVQPGETVSQALIRAALIDQETERIVIPPGVRIVSGSPLQSRIIERRTTGIPFLNRGDQP